MLKTIIFDLDGTLWQTTESYPYAYRRLCEFYGLPVTFSDDEIRACLGVKLDQFLPKLFPTVEDQRALAYRAMGYSIEYLTKNPEGCCYEGVRDVLETLSRSYRIYIVSNCLDAYVETFLRFSGTGDLISGYYTIESGEKREHIERIAKENGGKALFVGDSDDDFLSVRDCESVLFCYASYGYKDCDSYAYRIDRLTDLPRVVGELSVKERQLRGKSYRVLSRGENQITLIKNSEESYYFGFLRYSDDEGFDCVVKEAVALCGERELIGPMDGNTFYPYRLSTDCFDWRLYPDCISGERILGILEANGFSPKQYYTSTLGEVNRQIWTIAKRVKLPEGFRIVRASGEEAYGYVPQLYEVAVDAFSHADFYEPISEADFTEIYLRGLSAITPDLLIIYDREKPIAFNFCYEDPEKRFYVCKTTAIKQEYQNKRLILTIIDHSYRMMEERGYSQVLYHFQNDRTRLLYAIFKGHMIKQKRYALMELKHDK